MGAGAVRAGTAPPRPSPWAGHGDDASHLDPVVHAVVRPSSAASGLADPARRDGRRRAAVPAAVLWCVAVVAAGTAAWEVRDALFASAGTATQHSVWTNPGRRAAIDTAVPVAPTTTDPDADRGDPAVVVSSSSTSSLPTSTTVTPQVGSEAAVPSGGATTPGPATSAPGTTSTLPRSGSPSTTVAPTSPTEPREGRAGPTSTSTSSTTTSTTASTTTTSPSSSDDHSTPTTSASSTGSNSSPGGHGSGSGSGSGSGG